MRVLKSLIKRVTPEFLLALGRSWRLARLRANNAKRPILEVFVDIYARNQWDGAIGELRSGSGSTQSQAQAYVAAVRAFIIRHKIRTVVDLGCGNFIVGKMLSSPNIHYVGVDIVPAVIQRNASQYTNSHTEFVVRDFLRDELPAGDLYLVRQVLQHLSNHEIATALSRLSKLPCVLVTEHHPAPARLVAPNIDKPHGADTRLLDGSGVFVDKSPFRQPVELILETPVERELVAKGEMLRTYLLLKTPM